MLTWTHIQYDVIATSENSKSGLKHTSSAFFIHTLSLMLHDAPSTYAHVFKHTAYAVSAYKRQHTECESFTLKSSNNYIRST